MAGKDASGIGMQHKSDKKNDTAKTKGARDEFEAIAIVLSENKGLYNIVMEKMGARVEELQKPTKTGQLNPNTKTSKAS